jgi:hypothetical protein
MLLDDRTVKTLWTYPGSERGKRTLNQLKLVRCGCGATVMVDSSPTSLAPRCGKCGTLQG